MKHLLGLWMIAGLLALSALVALPAEPVRGMAFDVYVGLKVGMNSAGQTWYYLPTLSDPFTTAVTLTGGRISHLDRQKKF